MIHHLQGPVCFARCCTDEAISLLVSAKNNPITKSAAVYECLVDAYNHQKNAKDVSGVIQQQIQAQESIDKQHQIRQLETTNRTLLLSLQEERSLRAISDEQRQRALEEITEVTVPNNTLLTHLVKQHSPSEYSCLLPPLYNTYTPQVQVQSEVNIEDHKLAVVRLKAQVRALCSEQVQATNPHPLGKPQLISTPSVPSQTYYNDLAYNL